MPVRHALGRAFRAAVLPSFILAYACASPAGAWDIQSMNREVDSTAFIVRDGCSGTLVSLTKRIIVTAQHCVDDYISYVEKQEIDEDGEVRTVKREHRDQIEVKQNSYKNSQQVSTASYMAEIVGYRKNRDVAVLRIITDKIPQTYAAQILPDGETLTRGEPVTVVGNPLGLEASISTGVISALNRTFRFPWAENEDLPMIQVDAPINPGNSGGSLYNDKGQLIGIPAAGFRGADGLGLAVPIKFVKDLLKDLCLESVYNPKADDATCETAKAKKAKGKKDDAKDSESKATPHKADLEGWFGHATVAPVAWKGDPGQLSDLMAPKPAPAPASRETIAGYVHAIVELAKSYTGYVLPQAEERKLVEQIFQAMQKGDGAIVEPR